MEKIIKNKAHAKEVSILAWTERVRTGKKYLSEDFLNENPIIDQCESFCGYCQYSTELGNFGCGDCPLIIEKATLFSDISCGDEDHPFTIWRDDPNSENAQAVLDLIKTSE